MLLDEAFLAAYWERRYGSAKTLKDLIWPKDVVYLNESSIILDIEAPTPTATINGSQQAPLIRPSRKLKIYGSPYTPTYVPSAFQYSSRQDFWNNKIPDDADIVITHGPPRLHLDASNGIPRGCSSLAAEIARVRPRLHIFGHIHAGYGREDVVFDGVRRTYEDIVNSNKGWWSLLEMFFGVALALVLVAFIGRRELMERQRVTTMVNASVVGWIDHERRNELRNEATVVEL